MASMEDVAGYAYKAGLTDKKKLAQAVAVAWAESSGNPKAHNTKGGADARGLWQINVAKNAHPEYASQDMYDPMANAKAMMVISKNGTDWGPWQSYPLQSTMYLAAAVLSTDNYLRSPIDKAATAVVSGVGGVANDVADATGLPQLTAVIADTVQTPLKVITWLTDPKSWLRISYLVLGGSLVLGGAYIFAKPVVQPAVDAAKSAAKTTAKVAATAAVA